MEKIGSDLKAAREAKGMTLREVADATRISGMHLGHLEAGRYGEMPGGMYNRAFIRAYCACLGLDPESYLKRYESETAPPSEKPGKPSSALRQLSGSRRFHPLLGWVIMLLVSTFGIYRGRHWLGQVFSPYFSRGQMALPEPPAHKIQPAEPPVSNSPPAEAVQTAPAPDAAVAGAAAVPLAPPLQAPGSIRIEFQVLEKCWASVNCDGDRVMVKLLEPGDDQYFDARERIFLILGNAGGVRLRINGKPAKPVGRSGEVIRLLISAQNLADLLEPN